MRHTLVAIFLLTGLCALAGCGQTGRLYLPQEEPIEEPEQRAEEKGVNPEQTDESDDT